MNYERKSERKINLSENSFNVVTATFNGIPEEHFEGLNNFYNSFRKEFSNFDLNFLVIDDNSKTNDPQEAFLDWFEGKKDVGYELLEAKENMGITFAIKYGLKEVSKNPGYAFKVDFNADIGVGSTPSKILRPVVDGKFDYMHGVREKEITKDDSSFEYKAMKALNKTLDECFGLPELNPFFAGTNVMNEETLNSVVNSKAFDQYSVRWGPDVLTVLLAKNNGYRVGNGRIPGEFIIGNRPENKVRAQTTAYATSMKLIKPSMKETVDKNLSRFYN